MDSIAWQKSQSEASTRAAAVTETAPTTMIKRRATYMHDAGTQDVS